MNQNFSDRMRALSKRVAWLAPAAALLLGCAAESPTGVAARGAPAVTTSDSNFSFSITPADRTVDVRFKRVRSQGEESVSDFLQRVFASADAAGATRLIVDLRETEGGDAFLVVPLVKGVLAREQFNREGGLIVIVGPNSFSPAQSAATLLQRYAHPTFVEQPPI